MKKNNIIIFASAIITALSLVTATSVYAQQQQQVPSQAQVQQGKGPSEAQIQADIAKTKNSPEGQAIEHVKQLFANGLGQGKTPIQMLTALVQAGLMQCSLPLSTQSVCLITPPGHLQLPPGATPPNPESIPLPPGLTHTPPANAPVNAH